MGDSERPFRLNVQLIPKTDSALDALVKATAMSKTDLTNRALQLYAWVVEQELAGAQLTLLRPNGELDRVKLI